MKVTLNKANKLRGLLEAHLNGISTQVHNNISVTLNGFEASVEAIQEKVDEKNKALVKLINDHTEGLEHLYNLRTLIQTTNLKKGVNKKIADIAKANERTKFYNSIVPYLQETVPVSEVFEANKSSRSSSLSYSMPYHVIGVVNKDSIDVLTYELNLIKKAIRTLEEERNNQNHKILVDIPDEIESYLKKIDLI